MYCVYTCSLTRDCMHIRHIHTYNATCGAGSRDTHSDIDACTQMHVQCTQMHVQCTQMHAHARRCTCEQTDTYPCGCKCTMQGLSTHACAHVQMQMRTRAHKTDHTVHPCIPHGSRVALKQGAQRRIQRQIHSSQSTRSVIVLLPSVDIAIDRQMTFDIVSNYNQE